MNQHKRQSLRACAEELHKKQKLKKSLSVLEGDALKLLHELEVYQIELELSNEELLTARDTAEATSQKYTSLYDFSPSGYLTINSEGKIIELNLSAARALGTERSLVVGKSFKHFVSETDSLHYAVFLTKLFELKSKQVCELKLKKLISELATYCLLEGMYDFDVNESNCHIAMTDITRLKNLEVELTIAKEKTEENDQLESVFLSNISHEIRTPLNAILGFSELLEKKSISPEDRELFLGHINFAGRRLMRLIEDILDISKIESNQISTIFKATHVNQLIDELQSQFQAAIGNSEIVIHATKGLKDEESTILSDELRLTQILSNLIENAQKFTSKGTIEFGYTHKNGTLQFYVKDSGIGIDANNHQLIFERFSQAKKDSTKIYGGAGLGLSIVKGLVKLLGGNLGAIRN